MEGLRKTQTPGSKPRAQGEKTGAARKLQEQCAESYDFVATVPMASPCLRFPLDLGCGAVLGSLDGGLRGHSSEGRGRGFASLA